MSIPSARALVDDAHRHLLAWAAGAMREAGLPELEVLGDFPDDHVPRRPRLVLFPHRLEPWPKRAETGAPARMLQQRGIAAFPGAWGALADGLTAGLERLLPRARGGALLPRPPLAALPAGLGAWYRARGAPWVEADTGGGDGVERVCLPALGWRSPFVVRVFYIALAEMAPGAASPGVSALGALAVALNAAPTLPVRVPPRGEAAAVAGFAEALAGDLGGPEGAALREAAAAIRQPATWPLTLVPFPDIERDDVAALVRALGRRPQPALPLAVQIPLGAGPAFEPAGMVHVAAHTAPPEGVR